MAKSGIEVIVDKKASSRLFKALKFETAQKKSIRAGLTIIANEQIKAYTLTSKPSRPAGSNYRRTKLLQSSSTKSKPQKTLDGFEGEWGTTGAADYDRLVLGKKSQQGDAFRGRWKSTEEVEELATPKIVEATEELIDEAAKKI